MADEQTPEMLRLSLQELVLRVKICELGDIEETLMQALSPPTKKNIERAIDALIDVKALTTSHDLTPLGRQLSKLPLDVHLGKLLLLACIFKCLDAALTVSAILSSKSPFSASFGARKQMEAARMSFKRGDSDLLTHWAAYCAWRRVCNEARDKENHFCRTHFLNRVTLSNIEDLKLQLFGSLLDSGFVVRDATDKLSHSRRRFVEIPSSVNINSENDLIVNSVIAWSFYPKLLNRHGKGWRNVANNQQVNLHPTSVNKDASDLKWLSFYHIMQSHTKYNAHETNKVHDLAVALLCGSAEIRMYAGVIILDGNRARFSLTDWKVLLALKFLRARLKQIMIQSFRDPTKPISSRQMEWLHVWQRMFTSKSEAMQT